MNEEYHSLMVNDAWDIVSCLKGRKLVDLNGCVELSMH